MSKSLPSDTKVNRRDFLRGQKSSGPDPVRPPWTREAAIKSLCTGCDKCSEYCPEGIIFRGNGGYPEVSFEKGECTFCGKCADVCVDGVFDRDQSTWNTELLVSEACFLNSAIYCRSCGDMCQERAIRFSMKAGGRADMTVDTELCTGCGACVSVCPANAITIQNRSNIKEACHA